MSNISRDVFDKCRPERGNFAEHGAEDNNYFLSPVLSGSTGPHMSFNEKPMIVWTINDYLGLAQHPDIQNAAMQTMEHSGITAPMGARLMSGNTPAHMALEQKLALLTQKEESLLFIAGYLGVMGCIAQLVGRGDTIVIDQYSHACMIDGAFLAKGRHGAKIRPFKHNDMQDLERQLKISYDENQGGILIVTEGVFGMRGDLANLPEICHLKEKYGARLFLDDAHGLGVMGESGLGCGEYFAVQDKIDLYFSTFAKAFVSIGGFVSGNKDIISYLRLNSRPAVFSKAHPLVLISAIDVATDLIAGAQDRRMHLWAITQALQEGLRALDLNIGETCSPITPVYVHGGDADLAKRMLCLLRDEYQIFVTAVTAPVVPQGTILFRLVATAAHSMQDVETTLAAFGAVMQRLQL
ncbi:MULTISPECIES: aminotransferase class I/II-fold pyridoxal phosphate-dependent enzyme [unclassified Legionella]|uniref:aminotransferase class I/II-fold pyridoxal phosphate-dependent enzyme n=1 Tax=unclassified Legionella TaxID=2622702 RepID=UPI001054BAD4|nr:MULTISPECIES: aminotransferase class I/II-fold pyridoxal phosphate-dependent enzyme [unclassified Legionella]MDI9817706.1 aminotransferase class I/II-fold pyridoxal phosphate-dependent enzyme [Legionella sp. PL877]